MDNYIYHPLGDYAENYANGTIGPGDKGFPQSYDGHTNGGLDFNPGPRRPVHAMVDGVVTAVCGFTLQEHIDNLEAGFYVELKTNNFGYKDTVYIRYLEMGWLESPFAEVLDIKPGVTGTGIYDIQMRKIVVTEIPVKAGDIIGYTNDLPIQSALHIDMQLNPTLSGGYDTTFGFNFGREDGKGKDYGSCYSTDGVNFLQDGQILGNNVGGVGKVPYSSYNVFNNYWFCMAMAKPLYMEQKVPTTEETEVTPTSAVNMNTSEAQNFFTKEVPDNLITCGGLYTLDEMKSSIAALARREVGLNPNESSEYNLSAICLEAKVLRARWAQHPDKDLYWLMSNNGFDGASITHRIETMDNGGLYDNETLKEMAFNNFKYPGAYGFIPEHIKIVNNFPYANYGYYWAGYSNTVQNAPILKNMIVNHSIDRHSTGWAWLIDVVGNTAYFAPTIWMNTAGHPEPLIS